MAALAATPRIDKYRRDQAALGGRIAASASLLVRERLDVADPDKHWAELLRELIALIRGGRSVSEQLAMEFYNYLREQAEAEGDAPEQPDVPFPTNAVVGSMIWQGPRLAKSLERRNPRRGRTHLSTDEIASRVGTAVGRSAMRHTMNAGRATTRAAAADDPDAWGWARVTDGDPCPFCEMLATRGPVYKSAFTAGDETNRYHDGCGCSVVAVFLTEAQRAQRDRAERRKGSHGRSNGRAHARGDDGLTDRQRRVIEQVRREVHGS